MREKAVKIKYGEQTFLLDGESTIAEFLRSQHLEQLKAIVLRKVGDCLVFSE